MLAVKDLQGKLIGETLQFVTFDVPTSRVPITMALNVQKVKEVVEYSNSSSNASGDTSGLPSTYDYILGIYDLRGCPVPILDLKPLISKNLQNQPEYHRLVICEIQNIWIAFPVERTGRIITCPVTDFLPPPAGGSIARSRTISGLVRRDRKYIPVLDIDTIVETTGLVQPTLSDTSLADGIYQGRKILVVDDSKIVLKKLVPLFTRIGFKVDTAENGQEGLKKYLEKNGEYDVVFTDIEMPILDGIAMAREIKAKSPHKQTPVIFNSALSNQALIADVQKEALGQYIVKFDENLILKTLESVLKK